MMKFLPLNIVKRLIYLKGHNMDPKTWELAAESLEFGLQSARRANMMYFRSILTLIEPLITI